MHETKINTGASEGIPFGEALPGANGGLESVRATLDHKTRLALNQKISSEWIM